MTIVIGTTANAYGTKRWSASAYFRKRPSAKLSRTLSPLLIRFQSKQPWLPALAEAC
jgi:hypothetical protein